VAASAAPPSPSSPPSSDDDGGTLADPANDPDEDASIALDDATVTSDLPPFDAGEGGLCAAPLAPGDLAIDELMIASMSGTGDHGEWLEIESARDCALDLQGLRGRRRLERSRHQPRSRRPPRHVVGPTGGRTPERRQHGEPLRRRGAGGLRHVPGAQAGDGRIGRFPQRLPRGHAGRLDALADVALFLVPGVPRYAE
jgi:hypothetical protein